MVLGTRSRRSQSVKSHRKKRAAPKEELKVLINGTFAQSGTAKEFQKRTQILQPKTLRTSIVGHSLHDPSCQALPQESNQNSQDRTHEEPSETKWVTNYLEISTISCQKDP